MLYRARCTIKLCGSAAWQWSSLRSTAYHFAPKWMREIYMILQLRQWPKIYVERRSAIICAISAAAHTYMQSAHMTRNIEKWYCAKIANIIGTGRDLRKVAVLIPAQREKDAVGKRGQPVKGKLLESECAYYADFCYFDVERMAYIVEDVKGVRTPAYVIKRKLMLDRYGIQIREI